MVLDEMVLKEMVLDEMAFRHIKIIIFTCHLISSYLFTSYSKYQIIMFDPFMKWGILRVSEILLSMVTQAQCPINL